MQDDIFKKSHFPFLQWCLDNEIASADRIHGIHFGEDESLAVHDKIMWAICCKNMWESLRTVQRLHPFVFWNNGK